MKPECSCTRCCTSHDGTSAARFLHRPRRPGHPARGVAVAAILTGVPSVHRYMPSIPVSHGVSIPKCSSVLRFIDNHPRLCGIVVPLQIAVGACVGGRRGVFWLEQSRSCGLISVDVVIFEAPALLAFFDNCQPFVATGI